MTEQEKEDWSNVIYRSRNEGFHYCWKHYSSFKEIEDNEFHKLRKNYLKSVDKLEKYLKNKEEELNIDYE